MTKQEAFICRVNRKTYNKHKQVFNDLIEDLFVFNIATDVSTHYCLSISSVQLTQLYSLHTMLLTDLQIISTKLFQSYN